MSETIISKQCTKCNQVKPLSEFYRNCNSKNGYLSQCKTCRDICREKYRQTKQSDIARKRYQQSEKGKTTLRRYYQTDKYKIAQKRYKIIHSDQIIAGHAVNNAIRSGKLPRPDTLQCRYCPKQAKDYHHWSYLPEHQLDVIPICRKCHRHSPFRQRTG